MKTIRSEKIIHTEIAKIAKNGPITDQRGTQFQIDLRDLCELCVEKFRSEKIIHTEIAKIAKNGPITDQRDTNSRSIFATFAISV